MFNKSETVVIEVIAFTFTLFTDGFQHQRERGIGVIRFYRPRIVHLVRDIPGRDLAGYLWNEKGRQGYSALFVYGF